MYTVHKLYTYVQYVHCTVHLDTKRQHARCCELGGGGALSVMCAIFCAGAAARHVVTWSRGNVVPWSRGHVARSGAGACTPSTWRARRCAR